MALNVELGEHVGPFVFGASLFDVLEYLRAAGGRAEVSHPALDDPITLTLPESGVVLLFEFATQRLLVVDVTAGGAVEHGGRVLRVGDAGGEGGLKRATTQVFREAMLQPFVGKAELLVAGRGVVLHHDEARQRVVRAVFYHGNDFRRPSLPATGELPPVQALVGEGVAVGAEVIRFGCHAQVVRAALGVPSCVGVRAELDEDRSGTPHEALAASPTNEIKLEALAPTAWCVPGPARAFGACDSDVYTLTYRPLGLGFVFSAESHQLVKVMLHCNLPATPTFGETGKCPFSIALPVSPSGDGKVTGGGPQSRGQRSNGEEQEDDDDDEEEPRHPRFGFDSSAVAVRPRPQGNTRGSSPASHGASEPLSSTPPPFPSLLMRESSSPPSFQQRGPAAATGPIGPDTEDTTVLAAFGHAPSDDVAIKKAPHSFAPLTVYAFEGVAFEVAASGRISTVVLFSSQPNADFHTFTFNNNK